MPNPRVAHISFEPEIHYDSFLSQQRFSPIEDLRWYLDEDVAFGKKSQAANDRNEYSRAGRGSLYKT